MGAKKLTMAASKDRRLKGLKVGKKIAVKKATKVALKVSDSLFAAVGLFCD